MTNNTRREGMKHRDVAEIVPNLPIIEFTADEIASITPEPDDFDGED